MGEQSCHLFGHLLSSDLFGKEEPPCVLGSPTVEPSDDPRCLQAAHFRKASDFIDQLGTQLRVLADLSNDVSRMHEASTEAVTFLKALGRKIRTRKEEDFDIFTAHRRETSVDRRLCFVMMPFKPEKVFNPVYASIRRAVSGKKLKCVRSDNVFDTRTVIIDIWEKTRKAVVCIADTSPPNNPNVFYEIGLAHALPTRVILISRRLKPDEKYPFDVNYARCIFYEQTATDTENWSMISRELFTLYFNEPRKTIG